MVFDDTVNNLGIVQQVRSLMRVDATQWPKWKIVNSCNNWLDYVAGFLIATDKRFKWDDTNHTKLPIGTTNLIANQSDYSFLTDEQNNRILTLTRIDLLQNDGSYEEMDLLDEEDVEGALDQYENVSGAPRQYIKLADNIIRLKPAPSFNKDAGLKFYFQRTPSYFTANDTTKEPGVATILHRGFVIAAAYDGAMSLGLKNFNALGGEKVKEETKMIQYFAGRNKDQKGRMRPRIENTR